MLKRYRTTINSCLILLALAVTVNVGCKKPSDPVQPDYGNNYGDLKYTIDGLKDMTMERNGSISETITITHTSGKLEDVMLSCIGLPKGATAKFSPLSIATPTFNTVLTITCVRTPVGLYDVTVRGSSTSSGFTDYHIKLNVQPYANAATGVAGFYKENGACSQSGSMGDTVNVEKVDSVSNRINIKGFWSGVWSNEVYADLNANDNSINVPVQTTNGVTFSGSGSFTDSTIIIQYHVTGSTVNDNCSSTFVRVY